MEKNTQPFGIGGWLIVYLAISFGFLIYYFQYFWQRLSYYFLRGGDKYIFIKRISDPLTIFFFILVISLIFSLIYIFQKKKKAKTFNIIFLWLKVLIYPLYDFILLIVWKSSYEAMVPISTLALPLGLWAIIWTFYFIKSERVKNTFIR